MKVTLATQEGEQPGKHADAREAEAVLPPVGLAQPAAQQDGGQRAQVDAHVEDRESLIPAGILVGVELAHDGRNARLQEADADDDEGQRQVHYGERNLIPDNVAVHGLGGFPLERHQDVAAAQQQRAARNGAPEP